MAETNPTPEDVERVKPIADDVSTDGGRLERTAVLETKIRELEQRIAKLEG